MSGIMSIVFLLFEALGLGLFVGFVVIDVIFDFYVDVNDNNSDIDVDLGIGRGMCSGLFVHSSLDCRVRVCFL